MKTVFLHGLGQTAQDWQAVIRHASLTDTDCPALFSQLGKDVSYSQILTNLEERYGDRAEPFRICGLSLGAMLALDYAARHGEQVASVMLIGAQYQVPTHLVDFQNFVFHCMPERTFSSMGMSRQDTIALSRSMRLLDLSDQLKRIRCPVTILCGEKDRANLKAAKLLKEKLPQGELHIIAGVGHEINKEAPEKIAAFLRE